MSICILEDGWSSIRKYNILFRDNSVEVNLLDIVEKKDIAADKIDKV